MRDPLEQYLDEVMWNAALAPADEKIVRQELREHLVELTDFKLPPKEVTRMLKEKFGSPRLIGDAIARAKGKFRTWMKRQARRAPVVIAVVVLLLLGVRWQVAQAFYAAGNSVAPAVPKGSRVLVYKLATTFNSGDIVVFRAESGDFMLGIVKSQQPDGSLLVSKNGWADRVEPRDRIVGRVILNTR